MKNLLIVLTFLFFSITAHAQQTEIIKKASFFYDNDTMIIEHSEELISGENRQLSLMIFVYIGYVDQYQDLEKEIKEIKNSSDKDASPPSKTLIRLSEEISHVVDGMEGTIQTMAKSVDPNAQSVYCIKFTSEIDPSFTIESVSYRNRMEEMIEGIVDLLKKKQQVLPVVKS